MRVAQRARLDTEAIHHAIAAHDISRASELVTAHWYDYLQQGRLQTVAGWLDELGEAVVHDDPNLCLVPRLGGSQHGPLGRGRSVDRGRGTGPRPSGGARQVEGARLRRGESRAIHRYMSGNVSQAVTAGRHSLEMAPGRTPWRPVGCPVLGISLFWSGSSTEAEVELRAAVQLAESDGNHLAKMHALGGFAAISAEQGDYDEAARLAASSAQIAEDHSLSEHWATTLARVAGGEALERSGRMAEAAELVDRGVALSGRGVATLEQAYALLLEAELRHARGDADAATVLAAARRAITACADPGILEDMLARTERRLRRGSGGVELKGTEAQLSGRELAVLRLLPSGLSQREPVMRYSCR